jgi:hypothetical protein
MPSLKLGEIGQTQVADQAPKKIGFGLDLSKAKTIQQESLEKNEQIIQRAKENVSNQI